jgi:hypothetical protein
MKRTAVELKPRRFYLATNLTRSEQIRLQVLKARKDTTLQELATEAMRAYLNSQRARG